MTAIAKHADPWQQTVRCLSGRPREAAADRHAAPTLNLKTTRRARASSGARAASNEAKPTPRARQSTEQALAQPVVRVIDRPSSVTAIVYWSDAATCHYGYQGWRVATAEKDGYCALSGEPVHRGDLVYRPAQRDPKPRNVDAMILAAAMPDTESIEAEAA
jgi:Domain of unknown function (DUF3331)